MARRRYRGHAPPEVRLDIEHLARLVAERISSSPVGTVVTVRPDGDVEAHSADAPDAGVDRRADVVATFVVTSFPPSPVEIAGRLRTGLGRLGRA